MLSSLEEKNLLIQQHQYRVLDIFSKNDDLKNPRIRLPLQSFIDTFDHGINEITKLVKRRKSKMVLRNSEKDLVEDTSKHSPNTEKVEQTRMLPF